ncbi:MAG: aldehyde dehydrogenase family protein [Sandaracinaceae bacterium]|nr:aldehyde dehydrogenase family protein [Sandaracinaceae bacterium]
MTEARGDYVGGTFHGPTGEAFTSHDPAHEDRVVLETAADPARAAAACEAAAEAWPGWAARSLDERLEVLMRFRAAIEARADGLSEAISLEMGKLRSEARVEIGALLGRFALVEAAVRAELAGGALPGFANEIVRYRPHGVVGVLGPFNFPLHLCHAHVLPALLLGNTVVVKPSEVTPLAGQRYAEALDAAGFPPGVVNVVQGGGAVGAAIVGSPHVHGLAFTGSWPTGRRILEGALDRPEMLLALEMGGKNMCVVRGDADLRQAIHEVITSGYLTTGQRCTCSDRVLVHASVADRFVDGLRAVLTELRFGDPEDAGCFAGPMATSRAKAGFLAAIAKARAGGAEAIVEGGARDGGAFVAPSLHRLAEGVHEIAGYTDHELFGPDLCVETFDDDAEAIAALNGTPYGFAHSVFTQDLDAFGAYERDVRTGILNRNRSTNKASPRLPFGGVKKSGNFRPAGAWAGRNLCYPLAQIHNPAGVYERHAQIERLLPSADLDALEAVHAREETEEAARTLFDTPRPLALRFPKGGALPKSDELNERFHAGDRYVLGEKKPPVFDHLRSVGPWMVSVDDEPLSVMDTMSQTATLPAGFAPDAVVRAYVEGDFGDAVTASADTTLGDDPHALAYAAALRERAPGLPTVSFTNGGAEANEKAYALCLANAKPGAKKLLAFEGAFHGRTLLALYASHTPSKRVPFQIAGYEVEFVPAPTRAVFADGEPIEPADWTSVWGAGDVDTAKARWGSSEDPALRAEVESLAIVAAQLDAGGYFAVAVEPMQSEGGDRYLGARFHRALRLLTRARGVSLIVDEVQCGFGLGGPFLWHQRFGYVDAKGEPDGPDCLCFAKRAQVGVCMSRFDDPEPTNAFPASLARGRLHALGVDERDARRIEALVRPRLETLTARWGHKIENPRLQGYALAFELADTAELNAFLGQRFWRGAVVFAAGTRTARYRLSSSYDERTIDLLFDSIQRSLAWLEAHPGKKPPAWEDFEPPPREDRYTIPYRVRRCDPSEADALLPAIRAIEARVYEPARRDTEAHLRKGFHADGIAVVAEVEEGAKWRVVGSALAAPLEEVADVVGPDEDPMLGRDNTVYSIAVTVDEGFQGHGIGRALKLAQLVAARAMQRPDGSPRYAHSSGRNRIPDASAMARLNDSLGAYTVRAIEAAYEGEGVARYYRQPLGRFAIDAVRAPERAAPATDLASGLARPLAHAPASLAALRDAGALYGPTVNKITVLNYLTPAIVRATEWVAALTPALPHAYLCSSRDETLDKSIRALRWHRASADAVIAFEGAYVGHTTAAARSVSDPATHRQGAPYFEWPRVPHPADGVEASIAALRAAIGDAPEKIFGIYVEPVQERTGKVAPDAFWPALEQLRAETGVPVVFVETASAYYRSGLGAFAHHGLPFTPDLMIWWTGGQAGFVHTSTRYRVTAPFTLVSTWDGDELSLIQMHHQLRAARHVDVAAASAALDAALAGTESRGLGLYRVIASGADADALAAEGVRVRRFANGCLGVAPALDTAIEDAAALAAALR